MCLHVALQQLKRNNLFQQIVESKEFYKTFCIINKLTNPIEWTDKGSLIVGHQSMNLQRRNCGKQYRVSLVVIANEVSRRQSRSLKYFYFDFNDIIGF